MTGHSLRGEVRIDLTRSTIPPALVPSADCICGSGCMVVPHPLWRVHTLLTTNGRPEGQPARISTLGSIVADHVHAGRRLKFEGIRAEGRVPGPRGEFQGGALAERVEHLHPRQPVVVEPEPRILEAGIAGLARGNFQPLQAV